MKQLLGKLLKKESEDIGITTEWGIAWRLLRRNSLAMFGLVIVLVLIGTALFADVISIYNPNSMILENRLDPPSGTHLLGLDEFGRDILSRIIYGSRISLQVGIVVVSISALIGSLLGAISGYYGGKIDTIVMRVVDLLLAFPGLILAIAIMAAIGQSLFNIMFALGLLGWTRYARVVRGQTLSLREMEYVEAARAAGASSLRIIFSHILPNCLAPITVLATLGMASAIMAESALSFLGLGVSPPTPSWGSMLTLGRKYLRSAPHVAVFPGIAIMITVLGFNLLGDGLRDALDPRMRR